MNNYIVIFKLCKDGREIKEQFQSYQAARQFVEELHQSVYTPYMQVRIIPLQTKKLAMESSQ